MYEAGKVSNFNKFEEYKLFVEDTARFSERRQKVSSTYVAVNSIIVSAVALLVKEVSADTTWQPLVIIPVLVAGIVICLQWERLIRKYKILVRFRLDELRAMEKLPEMAGSSRVYHSEDVLYPRDDKGQLKAGEGLNFSDLERWLPRVFIVLYILFLIGLMYLFIWIGSSF